MGGMAKVQEMITGRRWKWVSSTATAGALERKEKFHPAPAHSQLVTTMSGQHTLHRQSGDQLKAQSRNCSRQSERTGSSKVECISLEKIIQHLFEARTKPAKYGEDLSWFKDLIWPEIFVFLIGTARDFFCFCKPGYPAHISISKVPLTLIKLDFMHLYQADIWQEVEWTQWLWQSWKKSVNGTGS